MTDITTDNSIEKPTTVDDKINEANLDKCVAHDQKEDLEKAKFEEFKAQDPLAKLSKYTFNNQVTSDSTQSKI